MPFEQDRELPGGKPQGEGVPPQSVMRAGLEAYVQRINDGDLKGLLSLFAPDAIIEDPVGSPVKQGEEIAAWFSDTIAFQTRITPVAPIRGSHSNAAALVFDVTFQPPEGPRLLIRSLDICTFDAQGRITSLKAYWGPGDIQPAPE
ncbi:putative delta(5)-3-ketosteroid isomerase [Sphingomonas paucimobilis]|uniref:nuclear transport factor 2 family protein n=1 Tax=Sphingobium TaxID=165695 RepID=UPI000453A242|nr:MULTISPECIES: nuclear transport factor 2 family protein [Sphingobium]EZP74084.1 putative delta(5)-3-ketosteroid isomerase [Sphingomonas paucimobilis]